MPDPRAHAGPPLSLLLPPYRALRALESADALRDEEGPLPRPVRGAALIWHMGRADWARGYRAIRGRPGGLALIAVLPPAEELDGLEPLLEMTEQCRPHSLLPHHPEPNPEELASVLRRPPGDLPGEVMDYITWRGVAVDQETRRLIRKTIELSAELKTVSGLSRSLYLSRRALGRRFMKRGLPVPSHWLHFARILRASIELQNTNRSLFQVACSFGYPDGFSLSNQMKRLAGIRPSRARECLGWEWIVEAWLRTEAAAGGLEEPLEELPPPRSRDAFRDRSPEWRERADRGGTRPPDDARADR